MKLAIVMQTSDKNNWLLGAFSSWIDHFSKLCQDVYVFTIQKDNVNFPPNVHVINLKTNEKSGKFAVLKKLYTEVLKLIKNHEIDCFFTMMCPVYTIVLFPFKLICKIPIVMWYAHGKTSLKFKITDILCSKSVTSSKDGYPVNSNKVTVIGQGIDTEKFGLKKCSKEALRTKIISVGRISPIKNLEVLIDALKIIKDRGNIIFKCSIAGDVAKKDHLKYLSFLKDKISTCSLDKELDFIGPVAFQEISYFYQKADIFVNLSDTGSLDKAVLEAMSTGLLVLTSNYAFKTILKGNLSFFMVGKNSPRELADKIEQLAQYSYEQKFTIAKKLREIVVKNHLVETSVSKIYRICKTLLKDNIQKKL